jgi:hypothetical protein
MKHGAAMARDQCKRVEARELLAPVYGWFAGSGGFDTLDLKEARALIDTLAAWHLGDVGGDRPGLVVGQMRTALKSSCGPNLLLRQYAVACSAYHAIVIT